MRGETCFNFRSFVLEFLLKTLGLLSLCRQLIMSVHNVLVEVNFTFICSIKMNYLKTKICWNSTIFAVFVNHAGGAVGAGAAAITSGSLLQGAAIGAAGNIAFCQLKRG